ncbi:MAG: tetratricopeptide repeat protein [Rhodoglobus sp.]
MSNELPAQHTVPERRAGLTVARLKRRRLLMFWLSLPVVLLIVFVAGVLLSRAPIAQRAIDDFDDDRFTSSQEASSSLLGLNFIEPYLAYFNRGDAFAAQGEYGPATDDFEEALVLAPVDRQCDVRLNLGLTWERYGDIYIANGFFQGAVLLYEASQAVLDDAGPECAPPEKKQQVDQAQQRVDEKRQDAEDQRDAEQSAQSEDSSDELSPQQQQLQELEQQQKEAAQEKADDDAQDRAENGGGGLVDKPW